MELVGCPRRSEDRDCNMKCEQGEKSNSRAHTGLGLLLNW